MTKGMLNEPKPKSTIAESKATTNQTKPHTLDHSDELVIFRVNLVISGHRLEAQEMHKNDGHEERRGQVVITTTGARQHSPESCWSAGPADDAGRGRADGTWRAGPSVRARSRLGAWDVTRSRGRFGRGKRVHNGRAGPRATLRSKRTTGGRPAGTTEPTVPAADVNNMAEPSARANPLRAAPYRRGAAEIFTLSHRNFTWLSVNCLHSFSCSIHWSSSLRDVLSSIIRT